MDNNKRQELMRAALQLSKTLLKLQWNKKTVDKSLEPKEPGDVCVVTGLFFPDKQAEQEITITFHGPMWMFLWIDSPINFAPSGETLIPRWMAPILSERGFEFTDDELEAA